MLFLIIIVLIVAYFVYVSNKLVKFKNLYNEAWSDVDVQLKKRHDLLPTLVESVKGYTKHESSTFKDGALARAGNLQEAAQIENNLTNSFKQIFALAEAYPDLKASQNFIQLQTSLVEIEDDLESARRYYNGCVRNYNTLIESFPSNLVAGISHHQISPFFELTLATEKEAPKVSL
ncbi:MAG: LemA family protein [Deltaproteobacteria bacterium]|nr:LemA family protein [Deltaproteobacteria bacterium]